MSGTARAVRRPDPPRWGVEAFDGKRLRQGGVWAVAFVADWCGFCRSFSPDFRALAARGVRIAFADVTDTGSPLWDRFEIDVVPTVLVFREGRLHGRVDGVAGVGLEPTDLEAVVRLVEGR